MTFVIPPHKKIVVPPVRPNGHWDFPVAMDPDNNAGFVYAIFDTVMGCGYIGRKNYHSFQQARKVPSDWKTYQSSSKGLKVLFDARPKEEFEFICLEQYKNRGDLAYAETWSIIAAKALESKLWYNYGVESVGYKVKVPPTPRHRERLDKIYRMVHG